MGETYLGTTCAKKLAPTLSLSRLYAVIKPGSSGQKAVCSPILGAVACATTCAGTEKGLEEEEGMWPLKPLKEEEHRELNREE